jgi:hypothetical protein
MDLSQFQMQCIKTLLDSCSYDSVAKIQSWCSDIRKQKLNDILVQFECETAIKPFCTIKGTRQTNGTGNLMILIEIHEFVVKRYDYLVINVGYYPYNSLSNRYSLQYGFEFFFTDSDALINNIMGKFNSISDRLEYTSDRQIIYIKDSLDFLKGTLLKKLELIELYYKTFST